MEQLKKSLPENDSKETETYINCIEELSNTIPIKPTDLDHYAKMGIGEYQVHLKKYGIDISKISTKPYVFVWSVKQFKMDMIQFYNLSKSFNVSIEILVHMAKKLYGAEQVSWYTITEGSLYATYPVWDMKKFMSALKNFQCQYCHKPLHDQCCCPKYHIDNTKYCNDNSVFSKDEFKSRISDLSPRKCKGHCVIYDM